MRDLRPPRVEVGGDRAHAQALGQEFRAAAYHFDEFRRHLDDAIDGFVRSGHAVALARPGEVEGRDYHFVSLPTFERMAAAGEFLESALIYGNRYGTSQKWIERERAEGREVLLVPHDDLGDADLALGLERLRQETVGLEPRRLGGHVVGLVEVDRIDLLEGDEGHDIDRLDRLDVDRRELLVGELNVVVLLVLVALDDLIERDFLAADRAEALVLDPALVLLVELIELERLLFDGGMQPDRDRHEPEADRAFPDRTGWHQSSPIGVRAVSCRGPGPPARAAGAASRPSSGSTPPPTPRPRSSSTCSAPGGRRCPSTG